MEGYIENVRNWWNGTADSEWYKSLRTDERIKRIVDDPWSVFHPGVREVLERGIQDFAGIRALLPSSGDNHAAIALALMGAKVTSSDISPRQLENAAETARRLGLDMEFVEENTMTLGRFPDGEFDLVYTSNGTHTWIYDIKSMYANIARVLKIGGMSVMYDIHPMGRPFSCEAWKQPQVVKDYDDTLPSCHWRVSDVINAHAKAGLTITEMAELKAADSSYWFKYDELVTKTEAELRDINDWKKNPMAALPAWMCVAAVKKS